MVLPPAPGLFLELVALGSAPCLLLEEQKPRGVFLVHEYSEPARVSPALNLGGRVQQPPVQ